MELYPFQHAGVQHLRGRSAILCDEPGLGKTVQAVVAWKDAPGPVLVITNLRHKLFWGLHIWAWAGVPDERLHICETAGQLDWAAYDDAVHTDPRQWVVTHWAAVSKVSHQNELLNRAWWAVIVDESHRMRDHTTISGKFLAFKLQAVHWSFLTATAMDRSVVELWPMLHKCAPRLFDSYWEFRSRFAKTKTVYVQGGVPREVLQPGCSNWSKFHTATDGLILRRLKSEVVTDLPPLQVSSVPIPLGDLQDQYSLLEKHTLLGIAQDEVDAKWKGDRQFVQNSLARITKLCQLCSHPVQLGVSEPSPKQLWLLDFLSDLPDSERVLIFVRFVATAKHLQVLIPRSNYVIGGHHSQAPVWPAGVRVLIATYGTLSESVNLNFTADKQPVTHCVLYDPHWSHIVTEQSINRVHRIDNARGLPVNVYALHTADTIEEDVVAALQQKSGETGLLHTFRRRHER